MQCTYEKRIFIEAKWIAFLCAKYWKNAATFTKVNTDTTKAPIDHKF